MIGFLPRNDSAVKEEFAKLGGSWLEKLLLERLSVWGPLILARESRMGPERRLLTRSRLWRPQKPVRKDGKSQEK